MLKRIAFFEGTIKPGREREFHAYVRERLVPLWSRFPGAVSVSTLSEIERDDWRAPCPLVLEIVYPDRAAMEAALQSPVRFESREVTQGLLAMLEGGVTHAIYEETSHDVVAA